MAQKALGSYLRGLRVSLGLPLRQVGEKMVEMGLGRGVSLNYLSQVERSEKHPSKTLLRKLATVYGVSPYHLLRKAGYDPDPEIDRTVDDRLVWAFLAAIRDPSFPDGSALENIGLPPAAMRWIVSIYEHATGTVLLSRRTGSGQGAD